MNENTQGAEALNGQKSEKKKRKSYRHPGIWSKRGGRSRPAREVRA